jgi:GNAT superfamily N-acetyltransferase
MKPTRINSIEQHDWTQLLRDSQSEGHDMVHRLLGEFRAGANRFDGRGEVLLAHLSGNDVVAVGGLNQEPDETLPHAGRVRRLYVGPRSRGQGLGRSLIEEISSLAQPHFDMLTVNVGQLDVQGFYERLGFGPSDHPGITHTKELPHNHLGDYPSCVSREI